VTATRNTPGNQRASAGKRLTRERTMLNYTTFQAWFSQPRAV